MRTIPEITKRPGEAFSVGLKYISPDLEEGGKISAATVTITPSESQGLQKSGNVVIETDTVSQVISGGVDGHEYYVNFIVITSGGHTYEDSIFVKIREVE